MTIVKDEIKKEDITLFAVYGTLRKGEGNNYFIRDAEYVGEYDTDPIYTLYSLNAFPGLVDDGTTSIKMEVYDVSNKETRNRLDILEGYYGEGDEQNLYNKEIIQTPFGEAIVYLYNGRTSTKPEIESGDWVTYKRNLKQSIKRKENETTC